MNRRVARSVVSILMESPFYLTLSLKERYDLMIRLLSLYSPLMDADGGAESLPETDHIK